MLPTSYYLLIAPKFFRGQKGSLAGILHATVELRAWAVTPWLTSAFILIFHIRFSPWFLQIGYRVLWTSKSEDVQMPCIKWHSNCAEPTHTHAHAHTHTCTRAHTIKRSLRHVITTSKYFYWAWAFFTRKPLPNFQWHIGLWRSCSGIFKSMKICFYYPPWLDILKIIMRCMFW